MIGLTRAMRVFAYGAPGGSAQGLQRVVGAGGARDEASTVGRDVYLFLGPQSATAKVLYFDGTGIVPIGEAAGGRGGSRGHGSARVALCCH